MTMPDLAEKLERAAEDAQIAAGTLSVMSDPCSRDGSAAWAGLSIALFALAAAHRDRATLDDHQARILPDDPAPSLAPICAELGLSPGEDVGAIVAAIRAVRERAVAEEREACAALCDDYAASCAANSMQIALRVVGSAIRARSYGGEGGR